MANTPENPVDGYQWKKFTAYEAPKVLAWMVGGSAVIEPEPDKPDMSQLGFDEGYAKGFAAGEAEASALHQATQDQLSEVLTQCRGFLEKQQEESLSEAATVMSGLFRALFEHELQTSEHLLQTLIDQIALMFEGKKDLHIHLSTSDYNSLAEHVSADIHDIMVADETLSAGVVKANAGQAIVELDVVQNMRDLLHSVDRKELQIEPAVSDTNPDE
jgi:flagellar biosynthesis/type III secretory pathway protein FliH